MSLAIQNDPIPLTTQPDGTIRVAGTRVTLDTIAEAFDEGLTAEQIAQQYPSLDLADIYTVIAYYIRHRGEIESYLEERARRARVLRTRIESERPMVGFRERLLARRIHP